MNIILDLVKKIGSLAAEAGKRIMKLAKWIGKQISIGINKIKVTIKKIGDKIGFGSDEIIKLGNDLDDTSFNGITNSITSLDEKTKMNVARSVLQVCKQKICDESDRIANGHAFDKHVIKQGEFPNITNREQFSLMIQDIVSNPSKSGVSSSGIKNVFLKGDTIVINNTRALDGGTVFKIDPLKNGGLTPEQYFNKILSE